MTFVSLVIALLVSAQCFGAVHAQDEAKSVNMNTAEEANLSHLKGIGEAKAQPPETIEDIMKSSGIGEKIFEVTNDRYCRWGNGGPSEDPKGVNMNRQVDWYYHRKGWTTCSKVSSFLETHDVEVLDTVPASRKLGLNDAVAMVGQADRLVVAKGKRLTELDLNLESPTDDVVTKLMLGPTGNLRAPTLRVGRTLVVGYNEQVMMETFGWSCSEVWR